MAITDKTEPFQKSLGEFADFARAYGVGKPIREIAAETADVSLSTLKKLMNGEHIRAKQFHAAAKAFNLRPLDWIELKIRYVEAYLHEYLFKATEYRTRTSVESLDLADFFRNRHDPERARYFPSREERFSFFIWTHFKREGVLPQDIASDVGASKKRDRWSVSRQTINSFRAGQHVIPKKFQYICDQLNINKAERSIAKILYTEAYLGEFLLGDDPLVLEKLNFENYPRTSALLTYSTENSDILA